MEPLKRDKNRKLESRAYVPWLQTQGTQAVNYSESNNSRWTPCRSVITNSMGKGVVGSWVSVTSPFNVSYM